MSRELQKKDLKYFVLGFGLASLLSLALGGVFFWIQYRVKSWPTVNGRIMDTSISESYSSNSDSSGSTLMYSANVNYVYYINGQEYTCDKVAAMSYSTSDRSDIEAIINKYNKGDNVVVLYNPNAYDDACLSAEISWMTLIPFIIGFVFLIPTVIVLVISRR